MRSFTTILLCILPLIRPSKGFIVQRPASGHTSSSCLHSLFPKRVSGDTRASWGVNSNVTAATTTKQADTNITAASPSFVTNTTVGIGGEGGLFYDVNRLKRNLLQETIVGYKRELYNILQSPRSTEAVITDKLAALVQSSAVRTTTDSNLLDGVWTLAYVSKFATIQDLKRPQPRFPKRRKRRSQQAQDGKKKNKSDDGDEQVVSPKSRRTSGKEALIKTKQMTIWLEDLDDDEDAHIVDDSRYFGGLVTKRRLSQVAKLTRRSIVLDELGTEWHVLGKCILRRQPKQKKPASSSSLPAQYEVEVVYLDIDLAVLEVAGTNKFLVFTKNEAWMEPRLRTKRKIRFLVQGLKYLFLRGNDDDQERIMYRTKSPEEMVDKILQEVRDDSARLRVLKLGDLNLDEDEAWDGMSDPFVHLSADERQEVLKTMNFREIEKAGNRRLVMAKREKWFDKILRRRRTFFRKPKS